MRHSPGRLLSSPRTNYDRGSRTDANADVLLAVASVLEGNYAGTASGRLSNVCCKCNKQANLTPLAWSAGISGGRSFFKAGGRTSPRVSRTRSQQRSSSGLSHMSVQHVHPDRRTLFRLQRLVHTINNRFEIGKCLF
jgi:hypothetical protein